MAILSRDIDFRTHTERECEHHKSHDRKDDVGGRARRGFERRDRLGSAVGREGVDEAAFDREKSERNEEPEGDRIPR